MPLGRPLLNGWHGCIERLQQPNFKARPCLLEVAMQLDLIKVCADSLRTLSTEVYNTKLKAAHAHELTAAFLGYKSKNAMLNDKEYPISNLDRSEVVVMIPDEFIDQRREKLDGLSLDLPDSNTLGEAIYTVFFSGKWWASSTPPFRSFDKLAKYLIERNDAYQSAFKFYRDVTMHHIVDVKNENNGVLLTVIHSHQSSSGELIGDGQTTIYLQRVAGHIGYGKPKISVEKWTSGARKILDSLGGSHYV